MKDTQNVAEAPAETRKNIEKLYTVADVALFFHLKENTIYRWVRVGTIKVVRIGTNVRIPHEEVLRIVSERSNTLKD